MFIELFPIILKSILFYLLKFMFLVNKEDTYVEGIIRNMNKNIDKIQ